MKIAQYIKELLYRYECVVIPGFGAFLAQRKPAEIHQSTHAFYPPKKSLSFNRQLIENDGLLTNYVSKAENVSYEKASERVNHFTVELLESLKQHHEVVLEDLGTFVLQNGKALFQPFYHHNLLLDSFGMTSFTSAEIERQSAAVTQEPAVAAEKASDKKVVPISSEKHQKTSEENTRKIPSTKRSSYLKYAAVGIIALGISGLVGANWYGNSVENHNLAEQQKADQQMEQKIQRATFVIDTPLPEIIFKVTTQTGKYHIVAGAFRNEENAVKKLDELKTKGFKARQIGVNKWGLHQVIYESHENRLEALKALRNIKHSYNNAAWLLVKEL